jgi:rare lipoprotein A
MQSPRGNKNMKYFAFAFLAMFALVGCSELELGSHIAKKISMPSDEARPIGYFKVGSPYRIKGRQYRPREKYQYTETGIASWYGPGFHGKMTANGEIFDENEFTAAHRTLQMPSIVRVTNLENGKSIILRVNDRGPFAHDRVIDLSSKAADVIGMKHKGTARVRVDVLEKESRQVASAAKQGLSTRGTEIALNRGNTLDGTMPLQIAMPTSKPTTRIVHAPVINNNSRMFDDILTKQAYSAEPARKPITDRIYVQTGAFSNEDNAMTMRAALYSLNEPVKIVTGDDNMYRVKIGPVASQSQADTIISDLKKRGRDARVVMIAP